MKTPNTEHRTPEHRFFQVTVRRATVVATLTVAWMMAAAVGARAQLPLFDGLDWVMDRGANTFAAVPGKTGAPPVAANGSAGIALRQGRNNFNARANDGAGNPDANSLLNNDPWHAVRRSVWPRTADITITDPVTLLLQTEIIDNPNLNDPNNDTDLAGNSVRVQPRSPVPVGNVNINMAHAFLNGGAWTPAQNIVPGTPGATSPPADYRSPAGGFSFSTDFTQVYTADYAFTNGIHNDFLVDRGNGNFTPATQGELAGLPFVAPEVYAGLENVLKVTNTATAVWELGAFNNTAARFTIDIYSPGDGTVVGPVAFPNVTRAIVRVSYGHFPTAADANDVQTVAATGQVIKAGVEDSRYSRLYLVDLGQSGWINIAPGGGSPAAFDYVGDPRYQTVVTLYTLTPDDVTDLTLFGAVPPKVTADAVRFNPQPTAATTPGLTQTVNGGAVTAANPALYSIAPSGRILSPAVGTNKYTNPPFTTPPFDIVTANDLQPLMFFAREESVPNTTPIIPTDPTQPVTTTNPLVPDPTLNATAPVFYCIDNKNSNATTIVAGNPVQTVSVDRVRWRYVGLPDAANGSGTASASPLLANVRCRDGILRPILYFVTTNTIGTVGHIYALDPLGNRTTAGGVNQNTTTAYWTYPSYRPLTTVELTGGLVPPQYHDPNYNNSVKYTTGIAAQDALETRSAAGALTAPPPFGADEPNAPENNYVDGDIIVNPAAAGNFVVRSDTQVPFPGVQSSPMIIDDPDNVVGAQILIVGGMNGRVYTFDAGGRGDFIYDPTHQNDTLNPATGTPFSIAGTTQRYWTWPHLHGDAFHAQHGSGAAPPGINISNINANGQQIIQDEPDKIAFPSSPAFDPNNGVGNIPFFIGAGDGHMFALFANHDKFNGIDNQGNPLYAERRSWVYPNLPGSLPGGSNKQDTQTLGAALSTPAIFRPTGAVNTFLYFTCAGRVYAINEHPALNTTPTMIPNTAFQWVFPATNNPPFVNPADSFSAPVDPAFNGSAPLLVSAADLNNALPNPVPVTSDFCYVVGGDATVYGIDASSAAQGQLIASGQSFSSGTTSCTPSASRLTGILGFGNDTTNAQPSLIFADDDGAIWGVGLRPDPTQVGVFNNTTQLPVLWGHFDSSQTRLAAASLVNGMIYEGSEDGQMRAYGVGTGADGLGSTLDAGEPAETGFGISPSGISIDLRGLNLYSAADYAAMTANPPTKTPARTANGGNYTNSAAIIQGTIDPNNGSNDHTTWPALVDWGDGLYIAAFGVYHAQPQSNTTGTHALGPPSIQVTLNISQPGQPSINVTLNPVFTPPNLYPVTAGNPWPDDLGITQGEHAGITIFGVDDPSLERNPMSNTSGELLTGPAQGVFPFAVFYKLPILPDATKPFTPGTGGYRVTARAVITQLIQLTSEAQPPAQQFSESSNFLQLGEHNYTGLQPQNPGAPAGPNNPVIPVNPNQGTVVGRRRDVLITNPLAVTIRSFTPAGGGAADMTTGNLPNIVGMGPSATLVANPFEVIGNGNRILNPYATINAATSPIKSLFAPIGLIPHGSSAIYQGVNGVGQKVSAFFIADRSNLAFTGPGGAGRHLRVRILTKPLHWWGNNTSVMNPLPWDLMPNNAQDTRDYPNMPLGSLDIRTSASGQDAVNGTVQLNQPIYQLNGLNPPDPTTRVVVPTEFTMTSRVPKFQPANVNRGIKQWKLADGTVFNFGSSYTDIGGNVKGSGVAGTDIVGPLNVVNGTPVATNSGIAFPAGGYVGELIVEAVPTGGETGTARFNPQAIFNDSRSAGDSAITQAYRSVELGLSVPPSVKMRVVESTIDMGKLPHGAGYSDLTNGPIDFRHPFSPSGTLDWITNNTTYNGLSPWDSDDLLGKFFRPFTLVNESNVNLYDVRVGKLMGDSPAAAANLRPLSLTSDQTSASLMAPPFLAAGARNAAGIGVVSSFDHISKAQQNLGGIFPERALWPIPNPYVTAGGIQDAATSGLQTVDAPASGVVGWANLIQPQPTVHKARVGDTTGIIATVPDIPYDALPILGFATRPTEVGLAIPLGTPVGTYSAPVFPYEDNVPLQWQEWLVSSNGFNTDGQGGALTSHDGVINAITDPTTGGRTPIEPFADPTFTVKVTVREARITGGVTRGTLPQIDTYIQGLLSTTPLDAKGNPASDIQNTPFGFNMLPAAMFQPTGGGNYQIDLYWSTPRQQPGSPYLANTGLKAGLPVSDAPWALGYSALFEGPGGWTFGTPGTGKFANAAWWNVGTATNTFGLFPGYDNVGQPLNLAALFPANAAEGAGLNPFVPGLRNVRSVRYASPAAAVRTLTGPPAAYPTGAQSGYLFWQGQIDKQRTNGATGANSSTSVNESRTFYAPVPAGSNGAPDVANVHSMLNDPALPKLAPKPLLLATSSGDAMFLFWHAGAGSQTQLYYNTNITAGFPSANWSRDLRLETPEALAWQSDPSPIYHQTFDTVNNKAIDVIDVVYTGVLKNRRTVETMLSRYVIDPTNFGLSITSLPEVVGEQMSRTGNTFNYAARDAAWAYGTGPQGQLLPTDKESRVKLYIMQFDKVAKTYGPIVPLVPANKGFTTDATGDHFPIGRYDPASGLVYYDSILGGQIVIDPRSGTVSFPQVAPGSNDAIFVNYAPMVMRLNTSRDETNIVRTAGYGNFTVNDPAFVQRAATTSPGSNQNPIAVLERDANERAALTSPRVVFNANANTGFPRLWVLYRKSDVSGTVKATLYYKAMRLMARLPRPVALTNNNGVSSITNLTVAGNVGPYEVDWVRGRVYFTELDEGRVVTINYAFVGGTSGNLTYRVAWGDEISATSLPADPSLPFVDQTTPEVVLPTDSAVNEGQVTAFQIPASLRTGPGTSGQPFQPVQGSELWVFWTSTRAGTTDLFYETIRPNFYPNATNQH